MPVDCTNRARSPKRNSIERGCNIQKDNYGSRQDALTVKRNELFQAATALLPQMVADYISQRAHPSRVGETEIGSARRGCGKSRRSVIVGPCAARSMVP